MPTSMRLCLLFLFLSTFGYALADDAFDCHVTQDGHSFDLTSLSGQHSVSRTRDTPPTTVTDKVLFDLCNDLTPQDGVSDADQCPQGTRVCLTKINKKDDNDRVVAVIPIAESSKLNPESKIITSPGNGLQLTLHGGEYPLPNDQTKRKQSLELTLLCSEAKSDPVFKSYDGSVLSLEWSAPAGCADKKNEGNAPNDSDTKPSSHGSGVGWFFLVLLLAFISYFALGAYYNYSKYGASGYDLIPHRDFWREVPYMLRDLVSHLCSMVRPRQTSRGGYIAV